MSNPEKLSHWKSLAALLGTESPTEPESAPPTSQPAIPPASTTKPSVPRPPEPSRPAPPKPAPPRRESNWGKLANILGLAGAPTPEAVAEKPEPVSKPVATEKQPPVPLVSQTSEAAAMAAAHWDTPDRDAERVVDPLEMTSEPFIEETLDAIDLETIAEREPAGESEPGDRPRRRRRRGRGRGRGRRPEGEAAPPSRPPTAEFDDSPAAETFDSPASTAEPGDGGGMYENEGPEPESSDRPQQTTGETEEGREIRRRRRRRGRGGRGRREERSAEPERQPRSREESIAAAPTPSHTPDDTDDEDDLLDAIGHEDELDDDDDKGDDSQLSHKKIPSWQEAIETVISTNMTSRANNPSSGSRGGRGRGRRDR